MSDTLVEELNGLKSPFSVPAGSSNVLRVGIILNESTLSAADCKLMEELLESPSMRLAALVTRKPRPSKRVPSPTGFAERLVRLYWRVDRRFHGSDRGMCTLDAYAARVGTGVLIRDSGQSDDSVESQLKAQDLDVILSLHALPGVERFCAAARYGLWWIAASAVQGDEAERVYGFSATVSGRIPVRAILWALEPGAGRPIALQFATSRRVSRTSALRNAEPLREVHHNLWLAGLRALQLLGWTTITQRSQDLSSEIGRISALHRPEEPLSGFGVAHGLLAMAVQEIKHRRRYYKRRDLWRVGIRKLENAALNTDTDGYRWLSAPARSWYADPFLFAIADSEYLFMEQFDEEQQQGRIVGGRLNADGSIAGMQVVLQRPYHLSYPHVFAHGDEIFMIPETGFRNTIELYRATQFPWSWEFIRVLYVGAAFDTTTFAQNGRLWFFTTLIEDAERHTSQLLLFHSTSIDGDWTMHPSSPITNDVRCARSAGAILRVGGSYLRPAQDGSRTYGGAVRFQKIESLNEREYSEKFLGEINPSSIPHGVGVHTYNRGTSFEAIDSRIVVSRR